MRLPVLSARLPDMCAVAAIANLLLTHAAVAAVVASCDDVSQRLADMAANPDATLDAALKCATEALAALCTGGDMHALENRRFVVGCASLVELLTQRVHLHHANDESKHPYNKSARAVATASALLLSVLVSDTELGPSQPGMLAAAARSAMDVLRHKQNNVHREQSGALAYHMPAVMAIVLALAGHAAGRQALTDSEAVATLNDVDTDADSPVAVCTQRREPGTGVCM
jgi:hypothetical protein